MSLFSSAKKYVLLPLVCCTARAQFVSISTPDYHLSGDFFLSSSRTRLPFWFYANQYGVIPAASPGLLLRAAIGTSSSDTVATTRRQVKIGYGLEGGTALSSNPKAYLIEGYASVRYGVGEVYAGRRRETVGLLGDTLLSSGSYVWSGNALPIPKIQVAIPQFFIIPHTKGIVAIKGNFAHGWLGDLPVQYGGQGITSVRGYLHQKTLYVKITPPRWDISIYGGFNHQAQWGGENRIWPHGLPPKQAWWYVIFGKPWQESRVGNHLGTIDLGLSVKTKRGELTFYRQNIYDDGSLYTFLNIKDGLNGVLFRNTQPRREGSTIIISKILVEYFNSTSQGGAVFDPATGIFGRDNYFNHYVYADGWSYRGKIIGTPFIPTQQEIKSTWPAVTRMVTSNNRVKLLHVAASGSFNTWQWLTKASLSKNFGVYDKPLKGYPKELSVLLQLQRPLPRFKGLLWTGSVSFDAGSLYDSSIGIHVGLRKWGNF